MSRFRLSGAMTRIRALFSGQPIFVRSVYAGSLLEDFFISAVGAVLAIRLYLAATGYPQLSVGALHIAHLVWGGLFMLVAMVVLLASVNHRGRVLAAILGGIGFGAFVDELGKFVTSDNDYFFRPAIAIMYVVFVVIFLAFRTIGRERPPTPRQSLTGAFEMALEGKVSGLHAEQREEAFELLGTSPPGPVRNSLEAILHTVDVEPLPRLRPLEKVHGVLDGLYSRIVARPWFSGIVVAFFAFTAVTSLYAIIGAVNWSLGLGLWVGAGTAILATIVFALRGKVRTLGAGLSAGIVTLAILVGWGVLVNLKTVPTTFADLAQFIFPAATGVIIIIGMLALLRSRLRAYLLFRLAILVSIFFTQVFAFYEYQLLSLLGLVLDILVLVALRYLIAHERGKSPVPLPGR